jgi:hypothetical protein
MVRRLVLLIVALAGILITQGCGYADKLPSYFEQIKGKPNAFRMFVIEPFGLFQPRESIRAIRVLECDGIYLRDCEVRWEVIADRPVVAEGFEVIAGIVPTGFDQVIPRSGQVFTPIPGKNYMIAVSLAHPLAMPWVETRWVAE